MKADQITHADDKKRDILENNAELEERLKNEIERRREKEEMLLQHTRQAAMGEMISMIAHQWRQPITAIGLSAENCLLDIELGTAEPEELKANLLMIREQVKYLSQTIDDFRNFFLPNKVREPDTIRRCVEGALSIIGKSMENHGIEIVRDFNDHSEIPIYRNELIQVFLNIMKNAQDVMHEHGLKEGRIVLQTHEDEQYIYCVVTDNAGGIPPGLLSRIFEPYFTTKSEQNGTGLGLYMSKTIIEEHFCGTIHVENTDNGASVTIRFPKECEGSS